MVAVMRPPWGICPGFDDDWGFLNEFSEGLGLTCSQRVLAAWHNAKNQLDGWFAISALERPGEGHPCDAVLIDNVNLEEVLGDVVEGFYGHDSSSVEG